MAATNMTDIHAHFFNLKYLPVAGIIRRYSNNIVPHTIAIGIERLFVRGTKSSIILDGEEPAVREKDKDVPVLKKLNKLLLVTDEKPVFQLDEEEIIYRVLNKITYSDLEDELIINSIDAYQAIEITENKDAAFLNTELFFSGNYAESDAETAVDKIGRMLRWAIRQISKVFGIIGKGVDYIRWFLFMQSSEHEMLKHLREVDEPGVTTFAHQLVDVDYYFNEPGLKRYKSFFDVYTQVKKMEQLDKEFPGVLYGFVAFDPSRPDRMDIIKDAIENRGYKGVKFYPPMGYRAFEDNLFAKQIDELFTYCTMKDIPLLTHCNKQGFEAYPKLHSGHNSNPMYWAYALKKFPALRVCLAHAGGGEGWFADIKYDEQVHPAEITDIPDNAGEEQDDWNTSYAKIVYKLCLTYDNVYCDAAYLDEVDNPTQYNNFKDRLVKLYNAEPRFSKKIIYGSDWHMLFQEGKQNRYLKDYIRLFSEAFFNDTHRQDFFELNARRYLKL